MYGQNQYGLVKYAENTPNQDDLKKYFVDLSYYVPYFISNIPEVKAIYNAQGVELGSLLYYIDDVKKQFYIDTATWGLVLWEDLYGIETNFNYSYEVRRAVCKAKKRGQGTCTKDFIKNVAESFSGGEVDVIENTAPYTFTVQFIGVKGIPRNMEAFKNMLEDIKPAHFVYNFKYTYTVWNLLKEKNLTWNKANSKNWDELKVYE